MSEIKSTLNAGPALKTVRPASITLETATKKTTKTSTIANRTNPAIIAKADASI